MGDATGTPNAEEYRPWKVTVGGIEFDLKLTIIIILAGLLPMIDHYHNVTGNLAKLSPAFNHFQGHMNAWAYDQLLLYFFIPLLVIVFVFRENPARYGVRLGNWKEGLKWMAVVCPIMTVILWFLVRGSSMQGYYNQSFYGASAGGSAFIPNGETASAVSRHLYMVYLSIMALIPWEFLWRGFFLFGLARVIGAGPAIFIQAIPFALLHLGKPEVETITTIFGGAGFGFIAWRTQSFLYALLIHIFILVVTNFVASGALG